MQTDWQVIRDKLAEMPTVHSSPNLHGTAPDSPEPDGTTEDDATAVTDESQHQQTGYPSPHDADDAMKLLMRATVPDSQRSVSPVLVLARRGCVNRFVCVLNHCLAHSLHGAGIAPSTTRASAAPVLRAWPRRW